MYIQRIKTKQGHPVPKTAGYAKGPFPPELFEQPEVISNYTPQPDSGDEEIPLGATAQNNFKGIRWFRCKTCRDIVPESKLGNHSCEVEDGEN